MYVYRNSYNPFRDSKYLTANNFNPYEYSMESSSQFCLSLNQISPRERTAQWPLREKKLSFFSLLWQGYKNQ